MFKDSGVIEKRLINLIEKLGASRGEILSKVYDYCVIPHDHQYVWFEEGIKFAKSHPSTTEIYRVWDNNCMYYLVGSEQEILKRIDRVAKN